MFRSATLKLTGWYLLILMSISVLFSAAIYQITSTEISIRLERLQTNLQTMGQFPARAPGDVFRSGEEAEAAGHIILGLVYANLLILIGGGVGSYLLARRTLRPIEEAHEAQSRFSSDASHELRTPLASMKAELEVILRDKNTTKKDLEEVLKSNLEEVEKLTRLSEMLLNLSRLEHGKLERSIIDIADVTNDVVRRFNLPKSRLEVRSVKHAVAVGNEAAVSELVAILVDNAIKYSPINSLVVVTLSRQGKFARFEITNTGPGIDADTLPHIFDRFYRADKSRSKRSQEGYGLGLSLAKKIVELHNGELTVTSTPDQSTSFTVLLPNPQARTSKI